MSQGSPTPQPQRHETLYLPDGNLVVIAGPSSAGVTQIFRVHGGLLAYNSPVFAGMLSLPMNSAAQEMYDGAPFVEIQDDPNDFADLMRAMYDTSMLSYRRLDPDIPLKVRGALSMATKYQIDFVRARIVHMLEENWPTNLDDWLRMQSDVTVAREGHKAADDGKVDGLYYDQRIPEPAAAIRLALDFDIPSILPAAFYTLVGVRADDDWDASRALVSTDVRKADARTARWSLLTREDLFHVIRGRERLVYYLWDIGETLTDVDKLQAAVMSPLCRMNADVGADDSCARAITGSLPWLKRSPFCDVLATQTPDPISNLTAICKPLVLQHLCEGCVDSVKTWFRGMQQEIWDDLPEMFGVQNL